MRIAKIDKGSSETRSFYGSPCAECLDGKCNAAEYVVTLGGHKTQVCKTCLKGLSVLVKHQAGVNIVPASPQA